MNTRKPTQTRAGARARAYDERESTTAAVVAVAEVKRKCHAHERARSFVSVGMTDRVVGVARRGGGNLCAHVIKKKK